MENGAPAAPRTAEPLGPAPGSRTALSTALAQGPGGPPHSTCPQRRSRAGEAHQCTPSCLRSKGAKVGTWSPCVWHLSPGRTLRGAEYPTGSHAVTLRPPQVCAGMSCRGHRPASPVPRVCTTGHARGCWGLPCTREVQARSPQGRQHGMLWPVAERSGPSRPSRASASPSVPGPPEGPMEADVDGGEAERHGSSVQTTRRAVRAPQRWAPPTLPGEEPPPDLFRTHRYSTSCSRGLPELPNTQTSCGGHLPTSRPHPAQARVPVRTPGPTPPPTPRVGLGRTLWPALP